MLKKNQSNPAMVDPVGSQPRGQLAFFTIVAQNYLAHAFVLGSSVLRYHPDATFSVFLMDDPDHRWQASVQQKGLEAIYPDQLRLANYRQFVFQYNVTEASTGVKPFVIQRLFETGAEKVIYLDPDILCFRRFDEVLEVMDEHCIVLTPHICAPAADLSFPDEHSHLRTGVFNLGFIALRKTDSAERFVEWWGKHLRDQCLCEPDVALFVDQKWVDLVPACFEGVFILRNPAYNIAYWNLHERMLKERDNALYETHSGTRVAFIHFSGFSVEDPDCICKYPLRNPFSRLLHMRRATLADRPDLVGPFRLYRQLLLASDVQGWSMYSYAYATYKNGEPISQLERSLYLASASFRESGKDPFITGPGSFHSACRKAGIRADARTMLKPSAAEIVQAYRFHIWLIEFALRCLLRILGPVRYLEFAKYMRNQFSPINQGFLMRRRTGESTPQPAAASLASKTRHAQPE